MSFKFPSFILIFALTAPYTFGSLPGCKKNKPQADSGIFRSVDGGLTWEQKNKLANNKILPKVDAAGLFFDPLDEKTIYLATRGKGVFVSQNRGETWQETSINSGNVYQIKFHPRDKQIVYVSGYIKNKGTVLKSEDSGKTWQSIYDDPLLTPNAVFDLLIDDYNPETLYIGTGWGGVLKSEDEGKSWKKTLETGERIQRMIMSQQDSRVLLVSTFTQGVFKTTDGGKSWQKLFQVKSPQPKKGPNQTSEKKDNKEDNIGSLIPVSRINWFSWEEEANRFYLAAPEGLFYNNQGSPHWNELETLPPKGSLEILAFAFNPQNKDEIIYSSPTAVFKSTNLGESWLPKKIMSKSLVRVIKYDPYNPDIIYLGTRKAN